jgi:hypothetical protein
MGDTIKAGRMGPASEASTPTEFVNSLAQRIEDEFWDLLVPERRFDRTTNAETDRDRRRLFVAIARGVVGYFRDNEAAFRVFADSPLPDNIRIDINQSDT